MVGVRLSAISFCLFLLTALPSEGFGQPAGRLSGPRVEVEYQGNRFAHLMSVPIYFRDLSDLMEALDKKSLPERHMAVLQREFPRELIGYVVAVTREGTLIVGAQIHSWDAEKNRFVFSRAEIYRSYPPLNGTRPWTWLVPIPVGREYEATLEVHAIVDRGPVRGIRMTLSNAPPEGR